MTKPPRNLRDLAESILRALERSGIGLSIAIEQPERPERLYTNKAAAEILGYPVDELMLSSPIDHVLPEDRPQLAKVRQTFVETGTIPQPCRLRFLRKDGTVVPCELTLVGEQLDDDRIAIGIMRDLRRELSMAEAVRESEANFRMLAEAAPDVIAVTRDGVILYINPVGANGLGYDDPAEIIGQNLIDMLSPEDARAMAERMARIAEGERLAPREYSVRARDGRLVTVEIASIPIDFHGQPANLAIGREVSERKQLQAELMQADRMATVGTLAAGVAHEINNPLTYVLLHLERMWRRLPALLPQTDASREVLGMVAEAIEGAERMTSIVRDLLAFSHPDSRDQRCVDVPLVLESTVKLASTGLKHRASIVTVIDECPQLFCSPSRLGQVFLNVLVNALQAVENVGRDGEVEVRLRCDAGEWLVVEVTDNGPGIDPQVLPRIFDPFYTTKPVGTGTGLGLPISRSIAESMGGSLVVRNRTPHGVRVELRLPLREPCADATATPKPTPSRRNTLTRPHGRILIVDDEPAVARALAAVLGEAYDTELCTDSAQAVETILGEPPFDAVFCDVSMPAPSGIDIYRLVAQQRPDYAARFAFITGGATTVSTSSALGELNRPVLLKPFEIDEVLDLAARLVRAS